MFACLCVYLCEVRLYCLCLAHFGTVFNASTGSITDHNQSAKDTDLYFKSQLYVEDVSQRKPALVLPNWLSRLGERAHGRN